MIKKSIKERVLNKKKEIQLLKRVFFQIRTIIERKEKIKSEDVLSNLDEI
jgi:hypothetical protein